MDFAIPHEEILNCMTEAVYVIDRDMNIRYVNPATEVLSGYRAYESLNNKCHNIFCEASDLCNGLCPPKTAMREKRAILHRAAETRTKSGELKQTQISFSPFFKGSECIGAVIVIKDITEVKKAEELVIQQNKFMRLVIDSLPHPFYVVDANDYTIKIANQVTAREGLKPGSTCYALTHRAESPCRDKDHPCPLDEVRRTKKPVVVEHVHYNAGGEPRNYEVHGYPIFNDQEVLIQMIEYSLDITDRKRIEEELRLYEQIVANMGEGVLLIRASDGTIIYANPNVEQMFGYERQELVGKHISIVNAPSAESPRERSVKMSRILNEFGVWSGESFNVKKDGTRLLCNVHVTTFEHPVHGTVWISIRQDVTERKKAEEERLKSHMLESIGLLAGGIAHDFNNLLTVIIGNINIARIPMEPDDKAFTALVDAEEVCHMASALSRRLLTFATGGDPIRKVMPLSSLLTSSVKPLLRDSNISLELNVPDNLASVAIDEGQIKQVFNNLTMNAKEAMPRGGILTISGENLFISKQDFSIIQEGNYVKISFGDNGAGIPTEDLAKIFDPYYSTKDTFNIKGLGLGLAVCYSVIKRHDGLITVESTFNKGTTFHIYLPVTS